MFRLMLAIAINIYYTYYIIFKHVKGFKKVNFLTNSIHLYKKNIH